jgi:hypothetical protein
MNLPRGGFYRNRHNHNVLACGYFRTTQRPVGPSSITRAPRHPPTTTAPNAITTGKHSKTYRGSGVSTVVKKTVRNKTNTPKTISAGRTAA